MRWADGGCSFSAYSGGGAASPSSRSKGKSASSACDGSSSGSSGGPLRRQIQGETNPSAGDDRRLNSQSAFAFSGDGHRRGPRIRWNRSACASSCPAASSWISALPPQSQSQSQSGTRRRRPRRRATRRPVLGGRRAPPAGAVRACASSWKASPALSSSSCRAARECRRHPETLRRWWEEETGNRESWPEGRGGEAAQIFLPSCLTSIFIEHVVPRDNLLIRIVGIEPASRRAQPRLLLQLPSLRLHGETQ